MANCVACGHFVVAWHPVDSDSEDDLICYNCGLHANSDAAARITALQERLRAFEGVGRRLLEGHEQSSVDWKAFRELQGLLAETDKNPS
ncbi:hypothetical protein [Marinobacter sp.]|uniref:hypothetical protein n=1 Tax=Marinobacter sp. TaxID=50741 RepID=UPI002606027F|nr:hypothetical protein [Marinobacter sp.]